MPASKDPPATLLRYDCGCVYEENDRTIHCNGQYAPISAVVNGVIKQLRGICEQCKLVFEVGYDGRLSLAAFSLPRAPKGAESKKEGSTGKKAEDGTRAAGKED
jgi:hypothetical protein